MQSFENFKNDIEKKSFESISEQKKLPELKESREKFSNEIEHVLKDLEHTIGGINATKELKAIKKITDQEFEEKKKSIEKSIEDKRKELVSLQRIGQNLLNDYETSHQNYIKVCTEFGKDVTKVNEAFNNKKKEIKKYLNKVEKALNFCRWDILETWWGGETGESTQGYNLNNKLPWLD